MEPGSGWVRRTGSPLQGWMVFSRDSADGAEHALTKRHLSQLALINYLIGQKSKERNGSRWRGEQVAACLNSNPGRRRREDCLCQLPRGGIRGAARRGGTGRGRRRGSRSEALLLVEYKRGCKAGWASLPDALVDTLHPWAHPVSA